MISHADIVPTLIEVAGGISPASIDGKGFIDVLAGKTSEHHSAVFASHTGPNGEYPAWKANWSPARAIRTRSHKYVLNLNPNYEFVCHITGCRPQPGRQPECYQPFWDSWVELAKTNDAARTRVNQYRHRPQHELYDLRRDPFEKENVADLPQNADLLKSLETELAAWRGEQGDEVPVHLDKTYEAPASWQDR
jgi:uncharacterized sulfatase